MPKNWIRVRDRWHILALVDARGWITKCHEIVNGDATVTDKAPPEDDGICLRCIDLEREPEP